jgi:ATP-dependent Clp protease adaptor protein ClpS
VSLAPVADQQSEDLVEHESPWVTVVWNDPVNLMSYVTFVFMTYFKYPREKAEQLMLSVHEEGRAAVSSGSREEMERDVTAMHSYGLWATVSRAA